MAAAYTITVIPAGSLVRLTITAPTGKGMAYTLSSLDALALASRLAGAAIPATVPVLAQSGMEVYVAPPSPPAPPPPPPQPVPVDPAFAALEAAKANKEANRLLVTPTPPPAPGGTSTGFGTDSK